MNSRLKILEEKREYIRAIALRHHADSISVFGSVAREEDGPNSDIDFLVDFCAGSSLFDLIDLQDELEAFLGCACDVVSSNSLKDRDHHIREEAIAL